MFYIIMSIVYSYSCLSLYGFKTRMKLVHMLLLLQSVTFLARYAVASSMQVQFSQIDSRTWSHQNTTECLSVWFEYNQATHDC